MRISVRSLLGVVGVMALLGPVAAAQADPPTPTDPRVGPPNSIAVIGDSISTATGTGGLGAEVPNNSWATGNNTSVNSNYRRILAMNPAISGKNYNMASNGRRMVHGVPQAQALPLDTEYVQIQLGGNDLCMPTVPQMTSLADYRSQFADTLAAIKQRVPDALVFVASVPDIYNLWYIRGAPNPPNPHQSNQAGQARLYWGTGIIPCQSLLANPTGMSQDDIDRREAVRQQNKDYNAILEEECDAVLRCRFDEHDLFNFSSNRINPPDGELLPHAQWNFTDLDISRNLGTFAFLCPLSGLFGTVCGDHFHPSLIGQGKLSLNAWEASYDFTDATAPDLVFAPDPEPNAAGWNNTSVNVGIEASGNAPIRGFEYRLHRPNGNVTGWVEAVGETAEALVEDEGLSYVEARALDVNGNLSASLAYLAQLDLTDPTIALVTPEDGAAYTLGEEVEAAYTCADEAGGSGLASCEGTVADGELIDTATVGEKAFSVVAADNAGNEATVEVTYEVHYDFSGFQPPIQSDSHTARAGSTLPVRFELADADGEPVSDAEANVSIAPAEGGPALLTEGPVRYDAEDEQYILPVSTRGLEAGDYELIVELDDGTEHSIDLTLR
jgi:hypothetical protein